MRLSRPSCLSLQRTRTDAADVLARTDAADVLAPLPDDVDEFKWPDLQPDGQLLSTNTSTLKPQETHQRGTHGIGDEGDFGSEYGGAGGPAGDIRSSGALYAPADSHSGGGYADPYAHAAHEASFEALAIMDGGSAAYARGYDPYPGGPIHTPAPAQGMVYPPSPPQYRSAGSSPYAPQDGFPSAHGAAHFDGDEYGHDGVAAAAASGPRGAPGAGGAARAQSSSAGDAGLPLVARSESPFEVPGLAARSSEMYGGDVDEKDERGPRGPL